MGYMTIVSILNDGLDQIEENPKEFVDGITKNLNGTYKSNGKYQRSTTFGVGNHCNQVEVYQSFHADDTQVFFAGWNSLVNINEIIDNINENAAYVSFLEGTLRNLDWVIENVKQTLINDLVKDFNLSNFKNESEVKNYFKEALENNKVYKELSHRLYSKQIFSENALYKKFEKKALTNQLIRTFKLYFLYLENGYTIKKGYCSMNTDTLELFFNEKDSKAFYDNNVDVFPNMYMKECYYILYNNQLVKTDTFLFSISAVKEIVNSLIKK